MIFLSSFLKSSINNPKLISGFTINNKYELLETHIAQSLVGINRYTSAEEMWVDIS